jgi:TonB-linked SusC/RagA family outer membrane protein
MSKVLRNLILVLGLGAPFCTLPAQTTTERVAVTSQLRKVSGKVLDANGDPLPGANIQVKGRKSGAVADVDGNFVIVAPTSDNVTLVVSFIGMKTAEVKVKGNTPLRIVLQNDDNMMEEVSIVENGYNRLPRKDMVGSYTTLKAEDVLMPAYQSIDQMLQGKVPGMIVTNSSGRVGATPSIQIRGTSTILGNTDPLWVVDGVIQSDPISIDLSSTLTTDMSTLIGNQISWLNPQDIETITVLKDASATAIYGSKASNGVIIITTKKGSAERTSVRYTANFSIRQRETYKNYNYMNSKERIQFSKEAYDAGARYQSEPLPQIYTYEGLMAMYNNRQISESDFMTQMERLETVNTDWLDILTRNSVSQNHNLSVSGGTQKVTYNASIGYSSNHGIEKGNDQEQFTARLNVGVQYNDRLHFDVNLNTSETDRDGYAAGVNPQSYALTTSRAVPLYETTGELAYYKQYYTYSMNMRDRNTLEYGYNILNEMANTYSKNKGNTSNFSLNMDYKLFPFLNYQFVGSIAYTKNASEAYAGEKSAYIETNYRGYAYGTEKTGSEKFNAALMPFGGELATTNTSSTTYTMQHKLVFSNTFNNIHRINAMLGFEVRSVKDESVRNKVWGYVPERGQQLVSPTYPSDIVPIGGTTSTYWGALNSLYAGAWNKYNYTSNYLSYFGIFAYSLKDRYVVNLNMREDASNRFGQDTNHQFNPTYSFGFSWRMAEENFIKDNFDWINQLNLRATYGIQGNVVKSVSPELIASYGGILYGYNEYYSTVASLPNPLLKWESTRTWNFGLDMQLFRGITMNLEYYGRRSNAIMYVDAPEEYGLSTIAMNGGIIYNHGVEASVNFTPFKSKDFAWTVGLNASRNWNKSGNDSRAAKIDKLSKSDYLNGNSQRPLKKGYPLNAFWSYSFAGLNQENGYPTFNLIDFEGEGDADVDPTTFLVYSGESTPYFTGGFNTRIHYKAFYLGADFSVLVGSKKRLPDPYSSFSNGKLPSPLVNLSKDLLKRWKQAGDQTIIPALYTSVFDEYHVALPDGTTSNSIYSMWAQSDAMVASGSFLRCGQISLSYYLPESLCSKFKATSLSVSATVNNLFVIASSRWNGFDPETGSSTQPRTYSFGLSVGF